MLILLPYFCSNLKYMRILALCWLLIICISCQAQDSNPVRLNADDFEKQIAVKDIQVLDVRTAQEFQSGHLTHALQADWNDQQQFADRVQHMDKTKPVYIYCLAGSRSTAAAKWMTEKGFSHIYELEGGINAWKKAGKSLEARIEKESMSVKTFQDSIASGRTILVDIGAEWCGPCRAMEPVFKTLKSDKQLHYILMRIDADSDTEILQHLNVSSIPGLFVYKKGKLIWQRQGMATAAELKNVIK